MLSANTGGVEPSHPRISDREEWILRLLYTPDETGMSQPMYGKTRIVKACFLLHRKLEEIFNKETGFEFRPYKYGPFDQGVYEALESLERKELIESQEEDNHDSRTGGPEYSLTKQGKRRAAELYEQLPRKEQQLLKWVKYEQAARPLGSFLSYIYTQYPNMTSESEIEP